jgi:hypothetical protein
LTYAYDALDRIAAGGSLGDRGALDVVAILSRRRRSRSGSAPQRCAAKRRWGRAERTLTPTPCA